MNFLEPLKINNIDLNKIKYNNIKFNNNYKIVLFKYNNNNNFVFQTHDLLNINSINNYNNNLELSLNNNSKGSIELINFITNLENKIKNDINNNLSWFNSNNDVIFQRLIRNNNCIKLKLFNNNKFKTLFKVNNELTNNLIIDEKSYCKLIIECYGIWINNNNNVSIYLRPIIVSIVNNINLYNYNFVDDSDTDNISNDELHIVDSYDNNEHDNNEHDEHDNNDENNENNENKIIKLFNNSSNYTSDDNSN